MKRLMQWEGYFHTSSSGFLEKEIKRANIEMVETGENPDAPAPREMIDLEVMGFRVNSCYWC